MKKIVFLLLVALCLPWTLSAQSVDDDLYYVPSKEKKEVKQETKAPVRKEVVVKSNVPTTVYTSPGNTTIVVKDRKGSTRDVDEYNRRYTSKENDFKMDNDTLYVKEKEVPDPDGEWVEGFDGSQDDYEYAMRIVRFRNPRYAVSISSPFYWDIVYGLNSWDWNVYDDGLYAYAFPTFSNRLWWDWRYNSYGWGGYPYYGYNYGWGGYYDGWYDGWYGGWSPGYHHHYYSGWNPGYYSGGSWGGSRWNSSGSYTNRRSVPSRGSSNVRRVITTSSPSSSSSRRYSTGNYQNERESGQVRRGYSTSTRRVVGTRSTEVRRGMSERVDAASSRRTIYTRPSSTRNSSYDRNVESVRSSSNRSSSPSESSSRTYRSSRSSEPTYSRGSSSSPARSYSSESSRRSSSNNERSYESRPSYRSSSSSSGSSYSGSSSSSSSSSSRSSGAVRSSGGGGRRR